MSFPLPRVAAAFALPLLVALATGCGSTAPAHPAAAQPAAAAHSASPEPSATADSPTPAPAMAHHHHQRHHARRMHHAAPPPQPATAPAQPSNPIPQGNGGDQDGDNNGGPSDGDGTI
jgi:hypothetical protein